VFVPGDRKWFPFSKEEMTMTVIDVLILLLIAAIAGAIGQAIAGYSAGGLLVSIAVGFIGALIGMSLARALSLPDILVIAVGGQRFPVIWSIIGAALFLAVIRLFTAPARRYYA
jgi:uncharacterized membrane protein YeaQ/YmgE (transglycosylase-associated protein family)